MKMIPGQGVKHCNEPNDPGKNITSTAAPKPTNDGVDLGKGYKTLGNPGSYPNANMQSRNR